MSPKDLVLYHQRRSSEIGANQSGTDRLIAYSLNTVLNTTKQYTARCPSFLLDNKE
jgi:hypothetical protein